jgi:radical SAM protein (TIGR01212 family)
LEKPAFWNNNKRYYDLKSYFRNLFGTPVQKLTVDAGFTCPNRDGKLGFDGCSYCDGRGSSWRQEGILPPLGQQIKIARSYYEKKGGAKKFLVYFQTFTNTYAPREKLAALWKEALAQDDVLGLAIGTRPDCLEEDTLDLLAELSRSHHLWLELGLQSLHPGSLKLINRGHTYECFVEAVKRAASRGRINLCAHIILGLPGETRQDMLATAHALAGLPLQGIKIHSLLALAGTALGEEYRQGRLTLPERSEYIDTVCDILEILPPKMVIHRLTAEGYQEIFLAPEWAKNKMAVLADIEKNLARRGSFQGCRFSGKL